MSFVSGLLWGGKSGKLAEAAQQGSLRLCSSEVLLAELGVVLGRAKLAARLTARGETAEGVLASARSICEVAMPPNIPMPPELRDPKDLTVLACAVAAEADAIITGDDDLLVLRSFAGYPSSTLLRR